MHNPQYSGFGFPYIFKVLVDSVPCMVVAYKFNTKLI